MEPKSPLPRFEQQPPAAPERASSLEAPSLTPEYAQTVERGGERVERRADDAMMAATPQQAILPVPVPQVVPDEPQQAASTSAPAVAADDDLIEKEWVDKAKQIIEQTRDDPHRREQEVSKLQAEYLRKRYGRELGASR